MEGYTYKEGTYNYIVAVETEDSSILMSLALARKTGVSAATEGERKVVYHDVNSKDAVFAIILDKYNGERGDIIRLRVRQPLRVTSVGVLIVDTCGNLLEMGYARRAKQKNYWIYIATRSLSCDRAKIIVDALNGDRYMAETRAEKVWNLN